MSDPIDTWVFLAQYLGTRVFLARYLTMATLGFPGPQSIGYFVPLFPRVFLARFVIGVLRPSRPRVILARFINVTVVIEFFWLDHVTHYIGA